MADAIERLAEALHARGTRRRAAQALAATAGSLLVLRGAARLGVPGVSAQSGGDDDDDDSSGRGRGRGRGRGGDDDGEGGGSARGSEVHNDDHDDGDDEGEPAPVSGEIPAGAMEVRIVSEDADGFQPRELTVDLGQTVAFVNAQDDEHTATGSGFDTGEIARGQVATVVLDEPGIFPYACQYHPEMTGSISVRDESGQVPQAAAQTAAPPADAMMVTIANLAFDPAQITVPTGATVAWTNSDSVPHTVTAADGAFDSGIFDPGATFSWTFDQPGSFPYVCALHPQMQGTVTAEGAPTAAAPADGAGAADEPAVAQESAPAAGAQAAPAASTSAVAVSIVDFAFEPAALDVPAGATVTWTNDGAVPHSATADGGAFDSGILEPGQTFSHTFAEAGAFPYYCAVHPDMTGTVNVGGSRAAAAAPAQAAEGDARSADGVWLITLAPDDTALLGEQQALLTLYPDGMLEADFAAAPGAEAPVTVLTAGRGEWVVQDGELRLGLVALREDANRRFAGTATISGGGALDAGNGVLEGSFEFALASAAGDVVGEGGGLLRGERARLDLEQAAPVASG